MGTEQRWKGWIQLFFGLGLTVLFFYMMAPFLVALLLGAVTAILCYPIFQTFNRRLPRTLSAFVVTLGVSLGILVPIIFVLYSGSVRLLALFRELRLPKAGASFETWLSHPIVTKFLSAVSRFTPLDREWMKNQTFEVLQGIVERLSGLLAAFLAGMPSLALEFIVVMISSFFFMTDGAKFLRFLSGISPLGERSAELYGAFEKSCRGVVLGLFLSAAVQGLLMAIFFAIAGLPSIIFIAVVTIIMGMVPVVGSAPLWIGAMFYLFANGSPWLGVMMLVGGLIISTSDNFVRAYLMKGHTEMHPLLALVSVFGAVNLMGPTGIFLGPVIAAVFVSFLRILSVEIRRESINNVTRPDAPPEAPL